MKEPQQLTLWPDGALPGQLSLFNRKAEVRASPDKMPNSPNHCETVAMRRVTGPMAPRGQPQPLLPPQMQLSPRTRMVPMRLAVERHFAINIGSCPEHLLTDK